MKYICIRKCKWTNRNGTISVYKVGDEVYSHSKNDISDMVKHGFAKKIEQNEQVSIDQKMKPIHSNKMINTTSFENKEVKSDEKDHNFGINSNSDESNHPVILPIEEEKEQIGQEKPKSTRGRKKK